MVQIEREHKGDIALQLLEDAKKAYDQERYYSAINLAGAASEVLCKLCTIYGKQSPHDNLMQMMADLYSSNNWMEKPKKMMKSFNWAKNTVKHIDGSHDRYVSMNARMRALFIINQAADAASELGVPGEYHVEYRESTS